MNSHIIIGVIFLLGGIFQSITAFLVFRGHQHYAVRFLGRKGSAVLYLLLACLMYFIAWFHLANR
ncbi:hypothetical protein DCM91_07860 [Chitinophaga costaii]|nr:hypothetical protein DCM91_07860 [Chitinophaga costaii]